MTEKRYVRILDHYEKEVRIFDEYNQKNIFNIFFMELDSAICLNGALEDTVDLLNYFYEEKKNLKEENEQLKEEIKSLTSNLEEDYILVKRNKNAKPTRYCSECLNYETEYEEIYAFGDYETLTKTSCSRGHHILDNTDATTCPDYIEE